MSTIHSIPAPAKPEEGIKVTAKDFILRYINYIPLYIISLLLCLALAYTYLRYTIPIFNAKATLLVKSDSKMGKGGSDDFEGLLLFQPKNNVINEIEVLKSQNLARRVARALGLQKKYYAVGNVKTSLLYPETPITLDVIKFKDSLHTVTFNVKLTSDQEFVLGDDPKVYHFNENIETDAGTFVFNKANTNFERLHYKEYVATWQPLNDAADEIIGGLTVKQIIDLSDVLLLTHQTIEPKLGVAVLDQLMLEYQQASVDDKNQIASRTISFINDRLKIITEELGDVEKKLQDFKQKNQVINIETQSKLFLDNQSDIDKQLTQNEVKLQVIQYLRDYLSDKNKQHDIVPPTLGIEEPSLMQLVRNYNELQLQLAAELKTTTTQNPLIINLESQVAKLRSDLQENLRSVYASTKMVNNSLQQKQNGFNTNINAVPLKEKELLEIARQQGIKQSLYLYLLQKREETAISLASTISNSQVIDSATCSAIPFKPSPLNVKTLAIFLGLLIPTILIYLRELLNDKVSNRNDIQKHTQTPIFGEIGHSDEGHVLVVNKHSRNVISEQFRMIRTNLQYLIGKNEKSVILVTSTFSGEGKTFASINLGSVMALAGKKTVILEFDIRKPKIISGLNLKRTDGITNYLVGNTDVKSLPVAVPDTENLFIIPCGPIPPNPAELLLESRIDDLFASLKKDFDIVIIDTAPIGLVSDAQVLSKYADCTLHIVRLKYTLKKQIQFIDNLYTSQKIPKMALLINDIKTSSHYYSYGNYGAYGYGYGYAQGGKEGKQQRMKNFFNRLFGR